MEQTTLRHDDATVRHFYQWAHGHPGRASDPFEAWLAGVQFGGRLALQRSSELAGLVPRLEYLAALFRESNGGSAYWHTDE